MLIWALGPVFADDGVSGALFGDSRPGFAQLLAALHPKPAFDVLVTMDEAFGGMPDVMWLARLLPKAEIAMRSNNRDVQATLCRNGAGLAVLPRPLGDSIADIEPVDLGEAPPGRDTWIGYHRDMKRQARLRALLNLVIERLAN